MEVTPEKKVVWNSTDDTGFGVHHFQVLDANGKLIANPTMR